MTILLKDVTPAEFEPSSTTSIVAYDSAMEENEGIKLFKSENFPTKQDVDINTADILTIRDGLTSLNTRVGSVEGSVTTLSGRVSDLESTEEYTIYGDLSVVNGPGVSVTIQGVTFLIRRITTTEIEVRGSSPSQIALSITHKFDGDNTEEAKREPFNIGPTGTIIATIQVGFYVLAAFYFKLGEFRYNVLAGSDDDELTQAWIEVKPVRIRQ